MRLSIATKVFLGFVAVLACSAAVSAYGVARLQRIGQGLSLLSRPYVPLTRAVSNLEAFQKERERSTDRLLAEPDPKVRANLITLDRTYFARVVGARSALGHPRPFRHRAPGRPAGDVVLAARLAPHPQPDRSGPAARTRQSRLGRRAGAWRRRAGGAGPRVQRHGPAAGGARARAA